MSTLSDRKKQTKSMILQYMMNHDFTTKAEMSSRLNLSMPTVINNTNELIAEKFVVEVGELESTGGRKAKRLSINKDKKYSVGIEITKNHISMVLVNMKGQLEKKYRTRLAFHPDIDYYRSVSDLLSEFIKDQDPNRILGVGFALPGIVNGDEKILVKSHALQLENYCLGMFHECTSYPLHFINDANAALVAELPLDGADTVYLSLNQTLGGAVYSEGKISAGRNRKAGEFGHMILYPGGKQCYCGKCGCSDAYLAASVLTGYADESMDLFIKNLKQDIREKKETERTSLWRTYLDNLAILITNLRMAYDTNILLGGDVGGFLEEHHLTLGEKLLKYNLFDRDISYIRYGKYKKEAPAIGAAKVFFYEYVKNACLL
ncbi:MAG: ROK family protein [Dorea sp.]|nr:ROK family protein [Dorea sp.]